MRDTREINKNANLLEWVSRDTTLKRKSRTRGGEWCGPCPWCGGVDRFLVWPNAETSSWWCRQCNRTGDAIAYVMQRYNVGFAKACDQIGGGQTSWESTSRRNGMSRKASLSTTPSDPPPAAWQEAMRRIVADCEALLWSDDGEQARTYLLEQRGLKGDTLRAFRIGYHRGNGNLRGSTLHGYYVHRGILIPWFAGGRLWKVQIRRPTLNHKERYTQVSGAADRCPGLFGADKLTGKPDCFVTEGELDAMLAWQEVRDFADVITLGSKDGKLADRWLPLLLPIQRFWIATDNDEGGHLAAAHWLNLTGERGRRIMPPRGAKDIGEAWLAGIDIRTWVQSALSSESAVTPQSLVPVSQGNGA